MRLGRRMKFSRDSPNAYRPEQTSAVQIQFVLYRGKINIVGRNISFPSRERFISLDIFTEAILCKNKVRECKINLSRHVKRFRTCWSVWRRGKYFNSTMLKIRTFSSVWVGLFFSFLFIYCLSFYFSWSTGPARTIKANWITPIPVTRKCSTCSSLRCSSLLLPSPPFLFPLFFVFSFALFLSRALIAVV